MVLWAYKFHQQKTVLLLIKIFLLKINQNAQKDFYINHKSKFQNWVTDSLFAFCFIKTVTFENLFCPSFCQLTNSWPFQFYVFQVFSKFYIFWNTSFFCFTNFRNVFRVFFCCMKIYFVISRLIFFLICNFFSVILYFNNV